MIGIVAAMDAEIHEFEKRMDLVDHTKTIAGCTLTYGKWQGKDVVLCKSGVGRHMRLCLVQFCVCKEISTALLMWVQLVD